MNKFFDDFEIESRKVQFGITPEFSFNDLRDDVKEEVFDSLDSEHLSDKNVQDIIFYELFD